MLSKGEIRLHILLILFVLTKLLKIVLVYSGRGFYRKKKILIQKVESIKGWPSNRDDESQSDVFVLMADAVNIPANF